MITVFQEDGKPLFDMKSEIESTMILSARKSFDPARAVCAGCGAKGFLSFYCEYTRWLIVLENGVPKDKELILKRYQCSICGKTHVVAPGGAVIPYMRHSLGFIITVMEAYRKGVKPVREIAGDFQITVATLYDWVKRFRDHYELLLGKLAAAGDIHEPIETRKLVSGRCLFHFVQTYGFCFLQAKPGSGATRYFTLRGYLILPSGSSP